MNIAFTRKQEMIQKYIRKFSREVLEEWSHYLDRESKPLPKEIFEEMGRMNIWGIQAPIELGGGGLDSVSYCIAIEEISRVSGATGLGVTVHNSVCLAPLLKFGSEEQIRRFGGISHRGKNRRLYRNGAECGLRCLRYYDHRRGRR